MFAGIAVLVATFSIYNTFSIIVAQRTREMALLRAVGASRRQVLASVVVEAIAVGHRGVGGRSAAGVWRRRAAHPRCSTPSASGSAGGLVVTGGAVVASLIVGIVVTLVAGVAPAVRASRIAPHGCPARRRRSTAAPAPGAGSSWARPFSGLASAAVLVGAAVGDDSALGLAGLGAVACLTGMIVLGPVIARRQCGLLGLPFARMRGVSGALARRNAMRNPGRTSATASALHGRRRSGRHVHGVRRVAQEQPRHKR